MTGTNGEIEALRQPTTTYIARSVHEVDPESPSRGPGSAVRRESAIAIASSMGTGGGPDV
jgi:hypothetical protein